jgi:hypothetical protein
MDALSQQEKELDRLRKAPYRFYLHGVQINLLKGCSSTIKKELDCLRKTPYRFCLHGVVMWFIEGIDFTIREGIWAFTKGSLSILFARIRDVIYWNAALPRIEKEFDRFQNVPYPFDLNRFNMTFIEWDLFHDKRRNLSVCERLLIDFICTKSWWQILNESSSTIKKGIWLLKKGSHWFYLHGDLMHLLNGCSSSIREWTRLFPKWPLSILFERSYDDIYSRWTLER